MRLSESVDAYCSARSVSRGTRRRIGYDLASWFALGGTGEITDLTPGVFATWRAAAVASGLRPRTVETIIATVRTLAARSGHVVDSGDRLRHVAKPPEVPSFQQFSTLIESADEWWKWWLAIAYVTGLRLGDIETADITGPELVIVAAKTGKRQRLPIPDCVLRLNRGRLYRARKRLRIELREMCRSIKIPLVTPQIMRAFSAMEWERARPGCGAIILGHAVPGWTSATRYYLDPCEQLFLGLPSLRIPPCIFSKTELAARTSGEQRLIDSFRQMDESKRKSLVDVASAMC